MDNVEGRVKDVVVVRREEFVGVAAPTSHRAAKALQAIAATATTATASNLNSARDACGCWVDEVSVVGLRVMVCAPRDRVADLARAGATRPPHDAGRWPPAPAASEQ